MTMLLPVRRVFGPTIQGEGRYLGQKTAFLRLMMCNLTCPWCDEPDTWDKSRFDLSANTTLTTIDEVYQDILDKARGSNHLVITGGEPMIHQKVLVELLQRLGSTFFIEIETNGTIRLLPDLLLYLDQINCSPKLANSGEAYDKRIRPEVLRRLVNFKRTDFKFVLTESREIEEVFQITELVGMPRDRVYLMAEGITVVDLDNREPWVRRLCDTYGFQFTTRLHVRQGLP